MDEKDIDAMAQIMIDARKADEDVGGLVAAALHKAATILGNVDKLVAGRPGSWEAGIVLRMAEAGGEANQQRTQRLAQLFTKMGKEQADGGDILSQAMGKAVDTLGGLKEFAGYSYWYDDLMNIGRQHSEHWNDPW